MASESITNASYISSKPLMSTSFRFQQDTLAVRLFSASFDHLTSHENVFNISQLQLVNCHKTLN